MQARFFYFMALSGVFSLMVHAAHASGHFYFDGDPLVGHDATESLKKKAAQQELNRIGALTQNNTPALDQASDYMAYLHDITQGRVKPGNTDYLGPCLLITD